jgi:excisionase family DNA binding protein
MAMITKSSPVNHTAVPPPTLEGQPDRLLRTSVVANVLQVSEGTVRKWIREGRLNAIPAGPRLWLIPESEIVRLLRGRAD